MRNQPFLKGKTDYAKDAQLFAVNGLLYHLAVVNNSGTAFWVQLWDVSASANIGSQQTIPEFEIEVPPGGFVTFPFHKEGFQFGKGCYVRPVTASQGSTIISGNNCKLTYQYDSPWPIA